MTPVWWWVVISWISQVLWHRLLRPREFLAEFEGPYVKYRLEMLRWREKEQAKRLRQVRAGAGAGRALGAYTRASPGAGERMACRHREAAACVHGGGGGGWGGWGLCWVEKK
eukprot:COSAG01_NODE_15950_length_1283_cov_2.184966_3_plen_111_part_01